MYMYNMCIKQVPILLYCVWFILLDQLIRDESGNKTIK